MYVELLGIAALLVYFASSLRNAADHRRRLWRYASIACASWLAESIAIHGYGFYEYSSSWRMRLGSTPLLVVLAWPAMILSAWDLAAMFATSKRGLALATILIVLLDGAFIEPICVAAGLWRWNYPGVLQVPIIGILGWGAFAGACVYWLWADEDAIDGLGRFVLGVAVVNLITHAALWALWRSFMRFLTFPVSNLASIAGIWIVVILLALFVLARRPKPAIPLSFGILRSPVALLIASLLLQARANAADLAAYSTAIVSLYGLGIALAARGRLFGAIGVPCARKVGRASTTRPQ